MKKHTFFYNTPVGKIAIQDNGSAITNIDFYGDIVNEDFNIKETKLIKETAKQLHEYFSGKRKKFDLPLAPQGTPFQQKVWDALQQIPYGETRSYKEIAIEIGQDNAYRAVGMANNKNPIAIIIPCHRVIGSNGKLVGYASGLNIKEQLLLLEQNYNQAQDVPCRL